MNIKDVADLFGNVKAVLGKAYAIIWAILVIISLISFLSYKKAVINLKKVQIELTGKQDENNTLRTALANPKVEQKQKIIYSKVTVNLTQEEIARYEKQLQDSQFTINSLYEIINKMQKEVYVIDGGSITEPVYPPGPVTKQKKINNFVFGLYDIKQAGVNGGYDRRIYKNIYLGIYAGKSYGGKLALGW